MSHKEKRFSDWLLRAWTVQAMHDAGWTFKEIGEVLKITGSTAQTDAMRLKGRWPLPYMGRPIHDLRTCECGGKMRCIDTRQAGDYIRRRRECSKCGKRITTKEFEET